MRAPDRLVVEVQRLTAEVTAHQHDPISPEMYRQAVAAAAHLKAAEHHIQEMFTAQQTHDTRPGGQ